jgi:hypothetical protein
MADARALTHVAVPGSVILAPTSTSQALALLTDQVYTVNPNAGYVNILYTQPGFYGPERQLLEEFANGAPAPGSPAALRAALVALHVDIACVEQGNHSARSFLESSGYAPMNSPATLACFQRSP